MTYFKYIVTFTCCLAASAAWGQFDKANDYFQKKEYAKAIPLFEAGLKEKESLLAKTRLAQCYQILNRMVQAESLFSEIVKEPKVKSTAYKHYAETLMSNGKYSEAKEWFLAYFKLASEDSTALQLDEACDKVGLIQPYFEVQGTMPAPFNSDGDDNTAVFGKDGLVFTSDRTQDKALLKQKSGATGRDYLKIWRTYPKDSTWAEPEHYSNRVNDLNVNTASLTLSANGNALAFTRNNTVTSKKGEYKMHLFVAEINEKGRIGKAEKLDFCSNELNYMHPALSPQGDMIVFSSDSKGEGGMDLFVSYKRKEKWSVPRNLGSVINSPRHEAFPFLHSDGRLFFASKGHNGFGGFDLFVTRFDTLAQAWIPPVNLGRPINSPSDDLGFAFAPDGQAGTFSSTRGSGNDDVYFFWLTPQEPNWVNLFKSKIETDSLVVAQVVATEVSDVQDVPSSAEGNLGETPTQPIFEDYQGSLLKAMSEMRRDEILRIVQLILNQDPGCQNNCVELKCSSAQQRDQILGWIGDGLGAAQQRVTVAME